MRGFAGLLVAAAFALVAFHSIALQKSVLHASQVELEAGLKMAQLRSAEDDMQASFQMVLHKAGQKEIEPKERAKKLVLSLAEWEKVQEEKYARQGVEVDAWFGVLSSTEKSLLPVEMLDKKEALKCVACIDLQELSLQVQNNGNGSAPNLFAVEEIVRKIVSGNFTESNSPNASETSAPRLPSAGAGWSIYIGREGISSISTGGVGN